ncbi:MAG: ribonuclease P protein component [Dehalococcoidia bacterium]
MDKEERLRRNSQFAEIREHGETWACDLVVLKAVPNGLGRNRYGFVTGKRLGKAVARNRVKRLLREVARSTPTKPGWDVVFIARNRAVAANYQQVASAVTRLLRRAQILADGSEAKRMSRA